MIVDFAWWWAQAGVLEAYHVTSCRDLPSSSTAFRSLSIKDEHGHALNPNWKPMYWTNQYKCGYHVSVSSDTKVVLKY